MIEFKAAGILQVGHELGRIFRDNPHLSGTFEIFIGLGSWWADGRPGATIRKPPRFVSSDGLLVLSTEERDLWRLEIEELFAVEEGWEHFPYHEAEEWKSYWEEKARAESARVASVQAQGFTAEPRLLRERLNDALSAIDASKKTGNPVEFKWG